MRYQIINKLSAVKLGLFYIENVNVNKQNMSLWSKINQLCNSLREKYNLETINDIETVKSVREMFKSEGMDPSRYRPSSEALLRRILRGQELYKINSVVDVNNWCSLEFFLPMGVYDAGNIVGKTITFRLGTNDESYTGIDGEIQNAQGKIIMTDEEKICGGPVSDSDKTMIAANTKKVLMVIYAPQDCQKAILQSTLEISIKRMITYNGGDLGFQVVIGY